MLKHTNKSVENTLENGGSEGSASQGDKILPVKCVRISDETFYFGSSNSEVSPRTNGSGKGSLDSNYYSSILSDSTDSSEQAELNRRVTNDLKIPLTVITNNDSTVENHSARLYSDSVFMMNGRVDSSSAPKPKYRLKSESTGPILKATELHQTLLDLRLHLNSLYAERHSLKIELEKTITNRENLLANYCHSKKRRSSTPPNTQHLVELREKLSQETARTRRLLEVATRAHHANLDPATLAEIEGLTKDHQTRRYSTADLLAKTLQEQIDILKDSDGDGGGADSLQERLLVSKNRICDFLNAEISRNVALLEQKTGRKPEAPKSEFVSEADRQSRLRILRFGLEERKKKVQSCEDEVAALTLKLQNLRAADAKEKDCKITDLISTIEAHHKDTKESRQLLGDMCREVVKMGSATMSHLVDPEMEEKKRSLREEIGSIKAEINELDSRPQLLCLKLESIGTAVQAAITKANDDCSEIKAKIRSRYNQLKALRPQEREMLSKIEKLDALNHKLSEVNERLNFAENLDRRAQDLLARQTSQVEDVKTKINRVKDLYTEEKRRKLELVDKLASEREAYQQQLMSLNQKLDRLGRQSLLKGGAQGAYKILMASFDVEDPEAKDEVDEFVGKRCAFFCQEIQRLQQHSAWLEKSLREVGSKNLSRQRLSAIRAVLDRGTSQPATSDVRRRNTGPPSNRPRPVSMIETVVKRPALSRPPVVSDTRRQTLYLGQPTASRDETPAPGFDAAPISARQRRLAYSQSLRERRIIPRPTLSFQRSTPTHASLVFKSTTPLIYTAFRSTKFTASRDFG